MITRKVRLLRSLPVLLAALLVFALAASRASAGSGCKQVKGSFTIQPVIGPSCSSPIGFCSVRTYSGDLKGTSTFTGTSLIQTVDTPTTSVVMYTADQQIQVKDSELVTKIAGAVRTTGNGEFSELETLISGSGDFAGVTVSIQSTGTDSGSGGSGDYQGSICRP